MAPKLFDIEARLSVGAANFDPDSALGGVMSTLVIPTALLLNLFDHVTSGELSAGDTEYRCYYIFNNHATDAWDTAKLYIQTDSPSSDSVLDIGLDAAGLGDGISTGVATTIVDESTAPGSVTFSHPTTFAGGLVLGDVAAGEGHAIWVRRIISSSGSSAPRDNVIIAHEGLVD